MIESIKRKPSHVITSTPPNSHLRKSSFVLCKVMVDATGIGCYSTSDIVGAVIGTFISTVVVVGSVGIVLVYVICRRHFRRQQHRSDQKIGTRKNRRIALASKSVLTLALFPLKICRAYLHSTTRYTL